LGEPAPPASARNRDDARDVALAWALVPLIALALGVVAAGVERQHRTPHPRSRSRAGAGCCWPRSSRCCRSPPG